MSDADSHESAPVERALPFKLVSEKYTGKVIYQDTYPGHLQNLSESSRDFPEISAPTQSASQLRYLTHSPTFNISTSVKSLP